MQTTKRRIPARGIVVALYRGKVVASTEHRCRPALGQSPTCERWKLRAEKARKLKEARNFEES